MRFLIIGQLPPPYTGQSLQIEKVTKILEKYEFRYRFIHLDFSENSREIGVLNISKVIKLIRIFFSICYNLIFFRPTCVYYPPAGPNRVPMYRDFILLFPIRLFKFKVFFRFHAGGISTMYDALSPVLKKIYEFSYFNVRYSSCMSEQGTDDPTFLKSKEIVIIPNGVKDNYNPAIQKGDKFYLLFVGACRESKGILDFIEVARQAHSFNNIIVGRIIGDVVDTSIEQLIKAGQDEGYLVYEGTQSGQKLAGLFQSSSVLLFPTFYESENFPTVVIEAFSYFLPVISTRWRGVIDQIKPGKNGFIHDIHDIDGMLASAIGLFENKDLYDKMAVGARKDYEEQYTLERYERNFYNFFKMLN